MAVSKRKRRIGRVASDAHAKTVVVVVERRQSHPLYRKTITLTSRYMAHDENNECRAGDRVLIEETRPLSKRKCWRVLDILERSSA
ncbi:MAG: 30S ribosomal protein S17 [Candidatus Coatesbacteria bacterium]|jgi:small subunit ribosomal protein S17|nr:30S ribosomal protein S17 [Candidatus Coatesbacteria bacterium]